MIVARITKGGQIHVPAAVRHRWGADAVIIEDRGDSVVLRPAPADPIAAAQGRFRDSQGPSADRVRRDERAAEARADRRRYG